MSSLRSRERLAQNEETRIWRGVFCLAVLERLGLPRLDFRLLEVVRREVDLDRLLFEREGVDFLVVFFL